MSWGSKMHEFLVTQNCLVNTNNTCNFYVDDCVLLILLLIKTILSYGILSIKLWMNNSTEIEKSAVVEHSFNNEAFNFIWQDMGHSKATELFSENIWEAVEINRNNNNFNKDKVYKLANMWKRATNILYR